MIEKIIDMITEYMKQTGEYPNRLHLNTEDHKSLCKRFNCNEVKYWRGMQIDVGEGQTEVYKSCNKQVTL